MKQMRAPGFRKNSSLKDFAVALSSSEKRKFCDFSGTRVVGGGAAPKLKFLPNLLKAKKQNLLKAKIKSSQGKK